MFLEFSTMHDIDRTQLQPGVRLGDQEFGYQEFESELFESELLESEGEGEAEFEQFYEGEAYEDEAYEGEAYEDEGEAYYETEAERSYADEAWEVEMAADLLAVRDEAELEQFLGNLVSSAAKGLSSLAKKAVPILAPALKSVAKQALPFVGGALGGLAGGPIGAKIGSQLASSAGDLFGLELEGLSLEDQEFEAAKQFVRFANDAVNYLGETAHQHSDPKRAAHAAVTASAQKHAPGLLSSSPSHQGVRAPHPGGVPTSHRNGTGAPHPAAPRPSPHAGPRPPHQGGPRPPHQGGPRPPHAAGAPATSAAPRPGSSSQPSPQRPSPGMPSAGRGPIRSPGAPSPAPAPGHPSAAHPTTSTAGTPASNGKRPGRLTVDGIFGYGPRPVQGASGQVGHVEGIGQGGSAGEPGGGHGSTGRWYRRGNRIVLIGV
jgi:hypothetical protein